MRRASLLAALLAAGSLSMVVSAQRATRGPNEDSKALALQKIKDLACLTDILPTGYRGCISAGVNTGSTVLISGAGPVGLAAASSAQLLGAAVVIVMDLNKDRLAHARSFGCETIVLTRGVEIEDQIEQILGVREVDCAVDCVGFEAKGHGGAEQPAVVLNQLMDVTRAGGAIGIPGLYVTEDPGAKGELARKGVLGMSFGIGWAKSISFFTGQTPVKRYNRALMTAILHDRIQIAKAVNVEVISLDQPPQGYADFDKGAVKKFVMDPHQTIAA